MLLSSTANGGEAEKDPVGVNYFQSSKGVNFHHSISASLHASALHFLNNGNDPSVGGQRSHESPVQEGNSPDERDMVQTPPAMSPDDSKDSAPQFGKRSKVSHKGESRQHFCHQTNFC
jgi:hypothetical protein